MKKLLLGNEAFAHAALAAGVRVVAGYPGTPSSEVIETIAAERAAGRAEGVHVEWSTNEKTALELLAAASIAGARTLFTCKQVGLNVASDALMSLNYIGVKGGMVVFVADDPGPISSQTEQDTRRFATFAKVPVFDPASPEQGFEMMLAAFDLSEKYGTPVILRSSTRIGHASSFMKVFEKTQAREPQGFVRDPRWVIFPKRAYEAHGEINERLRAIARDYSTSPLSFFNEWFEKGKTPEGKSPRIGILTGGASTAYTREALRSVEAECARSGEKLHPYRFMQVGTPYPFPEEIFEEFASGLHCVIVFEELDSVLEEAALVYEAQNYHDYEVLGKLNGEVSDRGELTVDYIRLRIKSFFGLEDPADAAWCEHNASCNSCAEGDSCDFCEEGEARENEDEERNAVLAAKNAEIEALGLPVRPPVLCAGCPHRGSFYAVKQALKQMKQEAIFSGDIGCYTLGNAQPLDMVDTCLCMGAGISMAQGFSVVEPDKKQVAFVGDSTFFASGIPGIVNALYNKHNICVAVLDNATTAMTGTQPHPGTGVTLMGTRSKPISIEAVLAALGFKTIEKANPFDLAQSTEAARRALGVEEPSAILFQAPCIYLTPPGTAVFVDEQVCTGCKRCITEIGCPALSFAREKNRGQNPEQKSAQVDASLCTGCGLCAETCPFNAIKGIGTANAIDAPEVIEPVNTFNAIKEAGESHD